MILRQLLPLLVLVLAAGCAGGRPAPGAITHLLDPRAPEFSRTAPDIYRVRFETSRGDFVVEAERAWAPLGADRFFNLVENGFYDGNRFFRVIPGFVAQFGLHGHPVIADRWRAERMRDDPYRQTNARGTLSFASAGAHSRSTQVFINLRDNSNLDGAGFVPFARVVSGMEIVDALYAEYGEGAPRGSGPDQDRIRLEGNAYLESDFPRLDLIRRARVIP